METVHVALEVANVEIMVREGEGGQPYQSLYGLKTYNLSEATNVYMRAF